MYKNEVAEIRHCLGLEHRLAENGDGVNQIQPQGAMVVMGDKVHSVMGNDDNNAANESRNMKATVRTTAVKQPNSD